MLKFIKIYGLIAICCYNCVQAQLMENLWWSNEPLKRKLENEIAESYSRIAFKMSDEEYYYWQGRNKAYREVYDWIVCLELGYSLD